MSAGAAEQQRAPVVASSFGDYVRQARASGRLVVQPRMGFGDPEMMRAGLLATKQVGGATVGTLTLDSYTRVGDHDAALRALADGAPLNGYPIVSHSAATTRAVLHGIHGPDFPVQVRHGAARPERIIEAAIAAGLSATEGGPASYCLPYGRVPLRDALVSWRRACELLVAASRAGVQPHLESFGGCMMGQLCPPGLLVAITVLEALFFVQEGLHSVSVSYTQQANPAQDEEAILALHRIASELLVGADWHIVLYTYMGAYPRTPGGARLLGRRAAELAMRTGVARLLVKTQAEAFRIPTVADNVAALTDAAAVARRAGPPVAVDSGRDSAVHTEARLLIDTVLDLDADVGRAIVTAFERGILDVPFCIHPDNAGLSRSYIESDGRLAWSDGGRMPIVTRGDRSRRLSSDGLLRALTHIQRECDRLAAIGPPSDGAEPLPC
ncbi:methylaspartate mutase [Plantactinospora sp. BC1]|uniref:methylaspartate mutase n=1 Tax=Plantactinospora sp. BC1 TaxID=2108470 RepID=UPI001F26FF9E|nr:methylaspartate mutase [Plantactinospora sp. BC1]